MNWYHLLLFMWRIMMTLNVAGVILSDPFCLLMWLLEICS